MILALVALRNPPRCRQFPFGLGPLELRDLLGQSSRKLLTARMTNRQFLA